MKKIGTVFGHPVTPSWRKLFPIAGLAFSGAAGAAYQDIDLSACNANRTYNAQLNTAIPAADQNIAVLNPGGDVRWIPALGTNCNTSAISAAPPPHGSTTMYCPDNTIPGNAQIQVTVPSNDPNVLIPSAPVATLTGTPNVLTTSPHYNFSLQVTNAAAASCTQNYQVKVTGSGGGWGDPHITTVDGVNYDFQGAGEFVALRGKGLEIQTRQRPVATAAVPGFTNPYTGLNTCVALYSAIATRVGTHRVSYQQGPLNEANKADMLLRVDGKVVNLTGTGVDLTSPGKGKTTVVDGQIKKLPQGDGVEIDFADGTKLVVNAAWWDAHKIWYLNINVHDTSASQGVMGITTNHWLPALSDNTSLGAKPQDVHQRYTQLYKTFADSWRVTKATSLFDYDPGTSTDSFTVSDWPRENPQSCAMGSVFTAQVMDKGVAEQHCAAITDENQKANCIFDVAVTGEKGFAQTYVASQQSVPGATKISVTVDKGESKQGDPVVFTAKVEHALAGAMANPAGSVQFFVNGEKAGDPIRLEANGTAVWKTANLPGGAHKVTAKFHPSGFGDILRPSTSAHAAHKVNAKRHWWVYLLVAVLVVVLIGIFRRKKS